MPKKFDAVCKIGETREGKAIWKNVGAVFENEKGMFLKLELIPVAPAQPDPTQGGLFIKFFEPNNDRQQGGGGGQHHQPPSSPPPAPAGGFDDDIPF